MALFADLDRLKAELDALRPLAPEQEARVLQKFRLEWNYNSNAIEGNSLTLGETRSLLLHGLTAAGKPMRDHLDIKGHNEAVVALEEFVRSQYPLTEQFIREMHQLLLGEAYHTPAQTASGQPTRKLIVPGRYKTSPNNVLTATGEMFYFASPEETPGRMTDLIDWYRAEEAAPTLLPVALAAEFHYRFVRIHPFDDGNGRMSRLLMNLILLRHGYPMTVIQAADRNRYLAALAEADAGEPEPFLRFIIENVEASLRLMIRAARGESIDEPSDLDKKLSLLKKQVLSREDVIDMSWGIQTQTRIWNTLLEFWFIDLINQTSRFNDLFLTKEIQFIYPADETTQMLGGGGTMRNKDSSFEGAMEVAREVMNNYERLINDFALRLNWLEFRHPYSIFNLSILLSFIFERHSVKVYYQVIQLGGGPTTEKEPIFTSLYRAKYNHNYISNINYQIANKIYDFIEAKVEEINDLPF